MLELNYKLQNLLSYFPKLKDALEIYFTLHELKPVSRLVISESGLDSMKETCEKLGLHYSVGTFKIINKICMMDNDADVAADYFVYFSKDESLPLKAKLAEEEFEDDKVGKLFGYPKCCREFYNKNYKEAKQFGNNLAPMIHKNSSHFHYLTNNLLQKFGYSLISHFPCKHNCMETIKYAKEANKILEKENPALAFEIRQRLRGPIFFHPKTGVQGFDFSEDIDGRWYYKKSFFIQACNVYNSFNSGNNLIVGKKTVKIFKDERLIKEYNQEDLFTFVFS